MQKNNWREDIWDQLNREWDVLVIGAGITGAGIFRMGAELGLKILLLEARDFAFGTSSRSSKLIHGGFRYLYNRQYGVTFESVREREKLRKEFPHLVEPLTFNLPNYRNYHFPSCLIHAGLIIYDLMAPKWDHQNLSKNRFVEQFPAIRQDGLLKVFRYQDAVLDDARLVLREIQEGIRNGGTAINYMKAVELLISSDGSVHGAAVSDQSGMSRRTAEVKAKVVLQASGPWSDALRAQLGTAPRIRKQRGSHLIFAREHLPVSEAITLFHPQDQRAMFIIPWEGTTLVGTTDIDHDSILEEKYEEPFASQGEIDYTLSALRFLFPDLALSEQDIISSFAGLRPIIDTGADHPSQESRAHQIWNEKGLITITGGKLTTYQKMASQTLNAALTESGMRVRDNHKSAPHQTCETLPSNEISPEDSAYLHGRYGPNAQRVLQKIADGDLTHIENLPNLWAEIRWAARSERILHLDDLLLRRVRVGLLLPHGGRSVMPTVRKIVQQELGWDEEKWQSEEQAYWRTWQTYYSANPG